MIRLTLFAGALLVAVLVLPACQPSSDQAAASASGSKDLSIPGSGTIPDADAAAADKASPEASHDAMAASGRGGERDHPARARAMVKKYTRANDPHPGPGLQLDPDPQTVTPVQRSEDQWRQVLSDFQYHILRERGTEPPHENPYEFEWREGTYACAACGLNLFSSKTKYDPHTGWPSFWAPIARGRVKLVDHTFGSTEAVCARCGSHLGDMFNDGPKPTGHRYCLDSASLNFKPAGDDQVAKK